MPEAPHPASLLENLFRITGPAGLLTGADAAPMLTDWRGLYHGAALAVLRPGSTAELSECVRACAAARVAMVPQGGNTSMVGGATPDESGRQIVVALTRMNRVREIDTTDMTMVCEAGLVLKAAQDAARQIRERLAACAVRKHGGDAAAVRFANDEVHVNGTVLGFAALVRLAYLDSVQLWSDGFYATPDLHWNNQTLQGHPFYYFAYGAAVSEVVVDTLTGEWKLLRADVLHDVGRSLNPAVDMGQIEGAFVQGMGWLTMEELVWHPVSGALSTHAPSTYKIPTANDCPAVFNVRLFDGDNVQDTIHRSKAVGEPPLLLPFSVFFAIRDAVSAVGAHAVDPPLSAPATGEAILNAVNAVRRMAPSP